ncbi:Uncharacterized protein Fot_21951 [Forsythia ovata]|uniref:Uncharacterized protein n=1 Tax=Forsythia ovata TaxID=205694 RepID=A0ABD1UWB4_9LAMI
MSPWPQNPKPGILEGREFGIVEGVDPNGGHVCEGKLDMLKESGIAEIANTDGNKHGQRLPLIITQRFDVAAATYTAAATLLVTTPPPEPFISPLSSIVPHLLSPPILPLSGTIPSSSIPQPLATHEGPSTAAIPTRVTSQREFDEDTVSYHGTGSQSSSKSEESSEDEEKKESSNDEDNVFSDEHDASIHFTRAQKGKQKVDERSTERSNIADLPIQHQNIRQPSSDIPTLAIHPQLFEQSFLHKDNHHVFIPQNYKFGTVDAQA